MCMCVYMVHVCVHMCAHMCACVYMCMHVCVCVHVYVHVCVCVCVCLCFSGCRLMASLSACQSYSPAEDLHTSQGEPFFCARQSEIFRYGSYMCTWNVRTLLDLDGSVETTKQNGEVSVMDERKIYKVVSKLDRYRVVVGCVAGDQVVWV